MIEGLQTALIMIDARIEGLTAEYNSLMEKRSTIEEGIAQLSKPSVRKAPQQTSQPVRSVVPVNNVRLDRTAQQKEAQYIQKSRQVIKSPSTSRMKASGVIVEQSARTPQGHIQATYSQTFIPNQSVRQNVMSNPRNIMDQIQDNGYEEDWTEVLEGYEED